MSFDSHALRELLEQGPRWGTFIDQYPRGNRAVSSNIINLGEVDASVLVKENSSKVRNAHTAQETGHANLVLTKPLFAWIEPTMMLHSNPFSPYGKTTANINNVECFPANNSSNSSKPVVSIHAEHHTSIQAMEIVIGNHQESELQLTISIPSAHVGSLNRLVIIEFVCKERLDRFSNRTTTFQVGVLILGTIAGIAPSRGLKSLSFNGSGSSSTLLSSEATPFIPVANILQFDSTNAVVISDDYSLKLLLSPPPQYSHIVGLLESVHAIDQDLYKQYVESYRNNRLPELALQHELNHLSEVIFREKKLQIQPTEYLKILYKLTIFEEIQTKLDIAKFDLHFVKINFELIRENNLLSISLKCKLQVQGSNESRPRILIGDKIRLRPTVEDCAARRMNLFELQGLVSNYHLQSEEVTCLFAVQNVFAIDGVQSSSSKLIELLSSMKFDVRFSYDRSSFAMMKILLNSRMVLSSYLIEALFPNPNTMAKLKEAKQMHFTGSYGIVPTDGAFSIASNSYVRLSAEFNQEQNRAICSVVDWCDLNNQSRHSICPIPPFIIFGPPGTGKTRTVTASILEILRTYPQKRILACAPSEAAADVIALRLFDALPDHKRMYRHNWWQRMVSSVPIKLLSCCCQHGNLFELPSVEQLMGYSVIVATCSAAGALAFFESVRFDVVIIDEASQATEAESFIPLSLTKPGGVMILAGDIHQLGPATKFPIYQDCAPATSLQERLLGLPYYADCLPSTSDLSSLPSSISLGVFLSRNYRSHHLLLEVPSKLFYGNRLIACALSGVTSSLLNWDMLSPNGKAPILFAGVEGKQEHDIDSPSFFNNLEVAKVVEICQSLTNSRQVEARNIGVIAAFRRQVLKIRTGLREVGLSAVNVGSVEDFQGQEVTAVVISTVTTSLIKRFANKGSYGMVNDAKRFNVSITRGMALCVVVGHPEFLYLDPYWRKLLDFIYQHGSHTGSLPQAILKWDDDYEEDLLNSTIETVMREMYPQISSNFARLFEG